MSSEVTTTKDDDEDAKAQDAKPTPPPSSSSSTFGNAAARGTLISFLFRIFSFGLSQLTFRLVSNPEVLGRANIQLELLLSTILFISREGFRLSCTRATQTSSVGWWTIPVTTVLAGGAALRHHRMHASDVDFHHAGLLYCLASWCEGIAEPAVLHFLCQMDISKRIQAEGLATIVKSILTVGLQSSSVTIFGLAQLGYGVTFAVYMYHKAWPHLRAPSMAMTQEDVHIAKLTLSFTLQGFFKHLLTEADKIVLTWISTSYDQGVYAMASAYGGMAARLLFQPLEENSRLLWTKSQHAQRSYTILVKLVVYIGCVFACFATNYTSILLHIVAGPTWARNPEASRTLSAFCVYTAFLACNGMTEAYVYAVATSITQLGIVHTVTGVVFAVTAPALVRQYGTVGLVAANCLAMALRTAYSVWFAGRPVRKLVPHPVILVCFAASYVATRYSLVTQLHHDDFFETYSVRDAVWVMRTLQHIGVGVSCVIGIATLFLSLEKEFYRDLVALVRAKKRD